MSTHAYDRWKRNKEESANTFTSRCKRYFAQASTPSDPGQAAYGVQCPCHREAAESNQADGCGYLTFDELSLEEQQVKRSLTDQVVDGFTFAFIIFFVLWVFRVWVRTRREEAQRRRVARNTMEEEEAKWRANFSGKEFVRVQQPDDSVELAEIIGDKTGKRKSEKTAVDDPEVQRAPASVEDDELYL
jgi:hypothetical protein